MEHAGLLDELTAFPDTGSLCKGEISAFEHDVSLDMGPLTFAHVSLCLKGSDYCLLQASSLNM